MFSTDCLVVHEHSSHSLRTDEGMRIACNVCDVINGTAPNRVKGIVGTVHAVPSRAAVAAGSTYFYICFGIVAVTSRPPVSASPKLIVP